MYVAISNKQLQLS